MGYTGRERRRRFVYSTRNTDYHLLDGVCIAVRDRRSGSWLEDHVAITQRLEGGARVVAEGTVVPILRAPRPGEPMFFSLGDEGEDGQVVTSRLQAVDRPSRDELARYPAAGQPRGAMSP